MGFGIAGKRASLYYLVMHLRSKSFQRERKLLESIEPWPSEALAAAYCEMAHEGWDEIEAAAARATQKGLRDHIHSIFSKITKNFEVRKSWLIYLDARPNSPGNK